jgi:hypothetical protein
MAAPEHLRTLPETNAATMANKSLSFYRDIPLVVGSLESRMLSLEPGTTSDPISATIHKIDLSHLTKPYTTLSYTWGDSRFTKAVTVNGETFQATLNLYDALYYVRSPDKHITIWVDAICINQWDLEEKSSQVAFMADLYRRCEKVYIWLGRPSDPDSLRCNPFALFEHFRDDKHYHDLPGFKRIESTGHWTYNIEDSDFRALWDGFKLVEESPWWTRAWTVQETILPPDAVVMYGDYTIHWTEIAESRFKRNAHLYNYSDECCGFSHEAIPGKVVQGWDIILGDVMDLETIRLRNGYFQTFQEVERAFAGRRCQDPRDKIWSLLSFSPSDSKKYLVDYTKPISEVFFDTFCNMLAERNGSLQCLIGYGFNSEGLGLPSWVRDFSEAISLQERHNFLQNRRVFVVYPRYNASSGRDGIARVVETRRELHLQGIPVDKVNAVGKECGSFWKDNLKALLDNWYRMCLMNGFTITKNKVDETFSRILCGEVIDDPDDGSDGLWRLVRDRDPDLPTDFEWSSFMEDGDGWALPRKYRGGVETAIDGRVLYTTEAGRIGLSCPSIQLGDEVWVIEGSKVPSMLRPETGGTTGRQLIGETYLYGVMHGECATEGIVGMNIVLV